MLLLFSFEPLSQQFSLLFRCFVVERTSEPYRGDTVFRNFDDLYQLVFWAWCCFNRVVVGKHKADGSAAGPILRLLNKHCHRFSISSWRGDHWGRHLDLSHSLVCTGDITKQATESCTHCVIKWLVDICLGDDVRAICPNLKITILYDDLVRRFFCGLAAKNAARCHNKTGNCYNL